MNTNQSNVTLFFDHKATTPPADNTRAMTTVWSRDGRLSELLYAEYAVVPSGMPSHVNSFYRILSLAMRFTYSIF